MLRIDRLAWLLWWSLLPVLADAAEATDGRAVTGVVVDSDGRPVAGAKVGTAFRLAPSITQTQTIIRYEDPPVVTDANGAFAIAAAPIRYTKVLVAAGPDGTLGYVVREPDIPARIRLSRPAQLEVEVLKSFGSTRRISFDLVAGDSAVGYGEMRVGKAWFVAPAGSLELRAHDVESIANHNKVPLSASSVTRLRLQLEPTAWALNVGKPAPHFTPTDVQNLRPGQSLGSTSGKWTLVEFWATWCVPCIREMPKYISFYERHAAERGRFEIVAVHSPDGASLAGIRQEYERLVERAWAGKKLPFPLVFDATGETQQRWGIEAYPTSLLIDPQGRIAGLGTLDELGKKLGL